ncbi:VWA domain-containing protein [Collinsella sp. AF29-7AC]|uniref:Spy0128 family protein n=1 Tax=Collinsella sp. AF29-7AC TaxID=2292010 RepID=UPI000E4FF281|nr:FctA domain-containing protein [Collinsella sp. AF29-7AC]RHN36806.1 VWA domain-containing protein [Collinsella sp. AF29-7AC]
MSKYTRGLLAVILAVVLVLPAAAFAMLPEANARSSTGMDGPTMTGKVVDYDTSNHWKFWAGGYDGKEVTTQNIGRIWTDKTVKETAANEESDFLTTLSAISSTSDTTVSGKPLDVVLVLDASGSMNDPMGSGDSTKRIRALKTAANSFIDAIAKENAKISDESKQHQVAIVKFSGNMAGWVGNDTYLEWGYRCNYSQTMKKLTLCKGNDATNLKSTVDSIRPNGATRADYGLRLANGVFSSGRADAKKIVVFFTDGSPTSSSGFEAEVANSAIRSAKNLKNKGTDIYAIGIFDGANPNDDPTEKRTSRENKFMHAVSSNYPDANSYKSDELGTRAENSDYYKSATSASELEKIFEEISGSIIQAGYPTEVHGGYGEHKSGYITFTDELGDFMQVDNFTSVVYNGETFTNPAIKTEGNIDTYKFEGAAANLVITVQHAEKNKPRTGDIVTVKIPASLIPLRHFKTKDGMLTVDNTEPVRVSYTSSVKKDALDNLFTPEQVVGLEDYIKSNTTTAKDDSKTVNFYASKWKNGALGDTIANFEPADSNRYYYFQKQTPIYVDESCTTPATGSLAAEGIYYYKDEFEVKGTDGKAELRTAVIEFTGGDAASFEGAIVPDASGNLSFSKGTARLAFIDELHTTKERVGGNPTGTATDVLNPKWNNMSAKSNATEVDVHLGNNGKISYKYDMTPATVDTKAKFGLTKVLEGREWADTDKFEFGLTSENGAPMPAATTAIVHKADLDQGKAAIGFGTIEYAEPGTYVYKVSEKHAGTTIDGIAYSGNVAEITVTVTPDKKGELSAAVKVAWSEPEVTEFKNVYAADPVESSVTDEIKVAKSLTGRDLKDGEFSFELREIKGEDSELIETVKNDANGNVVFSAIKYTEAGEHTYTLSEVKGNAGGITYDETVYTIVATISDNDKGQLVATHKLKGAEDVKSIEFKNAYTANAAEASLAGIKNLQFAKGLTPADIAGKFTFTVTGEEGAPMPANTSVTNDAKGKVDFGKITFTLDDLNKALGEKPEKREHTFTYTVTESGEVAGVTNDAKPSRTVSFTVTDDGEGKLSVSRNPDGNAAFTFTNTYSVTPFETSVTDQITATKVLTGRDMAEGEFSFELVKGEGKDAKVVATGTNAADGKITMSAVKYDKAGTHTYTLHEVNGGTTSKGVTYSDAKFTIETTITDNGDGTLSAQHVLKNAEAAIFKNTYSVTPIDTELDFGLSKAIDGRDWTDGDEFSFTITAPEGTPLPDPATVTVSKKDAKGGIVAIKFGKIHYAAAGTYKYEIRENVGSTVGMTYDAHVATAEVTVTEDSDGTLTANVTKKENGRFTNTYRTELDYAAAGGLKLSKTLYGRPMTEGQFTFTVTPADDDSASALGLLPGANNYESPATIEGTVGQIDILAGHEVKFTQADAGKTFTYTVAEKNDGQPGYTYDDAVRTVTIAIADDTAGTLTATTTVSGGSEGTLVTEYKTGAAAVESAVVPFVNSYSATTDAPGGTAAQVVAAKTLTGRPMVDGEFWFGIAYQGELVGYENLKPNIGGHVSFDALHYDAKMLADLESAGLAHRTDKDGKLAWTINYTAYEAIHGLPNGVSATTWYFGFKVIVVDNGDGTLTATVDYGGIEPLFENVYGADAVDAALAGTKKLQAAEGLTPADITGKFTFTVAADEAGAPMPERTTATNDAAGNVDFGKIHFTLEDLNRALGVTDDATDKAEADEADEAEADEAEAEEADADADANADEPSDESEPAAPTAPRSHTFTYTVAESGSAPGVINDANATRKVSYTVTDDGAGHLIVKRDGGDGAAFTFTNTYSVTPTDSSVTDQVKTVKRLTGRDLAAGEFTFELLEDGVAVASGTNDVNGNVTLSPIHYEAPGTHTYMLREACPNALGLYKGVTYDGTTYTVVTTVSDNGDGTLTATHKLEGTTESAGFTNKYHAMPTQVSIGAIKVLEGRELKKDEFSFKLVGEDIESTVTNDADGKINFDKFEYDEPGAYVYTISEVKGDEAGMTYDKSVFTATVNVVDDGEGNLKANVAFTKGDKSVEGIVFNNTYKKPETPTPTPDPGMPKTVTNIVKTVKGFLPTTGDQQAAALLMAFVIAMAGVGALVWGIRKR